MARQIRVQQQYCNEDLHIDKKQPLGRGSYGAVYKAKCDQLPCAAKVIHRTIVDSRDPGSEKIKEKFWQECTFLSGIRHPNIVLYLGVSRDGESGLPVLLMELLDESLTKMLERSQSSLAYHVQVDICHDVSLAVAYLHSKDIIHRDLSSNNVLIIAGRRAKVTDFGMSKLVRAVPRMSRLTLCPGTLAYMPPEALKEPPRYTKKLDCFSEGVITIQVCTRLWPEPGPRFQPVPDSRSPTGKVEMPVLETERRKSHLDLIDPLNPLRKIAIECLKYQEEERPSSEKLCKRLADLKDSSKYEDDVKQQDADSQAKDKKIVSQSQQLKAKDRELREKQMELEEKSHELQLKDSKICKQKILQQKQAASAATQIKQLTKTVLKQEEVTTKLQLTRHSLQGHVKDLQRQLKIYTRQNPCNKQPSRSPLTWKDGGKAPFDIIRGSSVVDGDKAYFMGSDGKVCCYNSTKREWSVLPQYPYIGGCLVIFNGQLTGIGGCTNWLKKDTYTNKLFTFYEGWLRNSWTDSEVFPPMPTKRRDACALVAKDHLIVAGGADGPGFANKSTVEVMHAHVTSKRHFWTRVASLPHPYNCASITFCGDHIYMLGGWNDKEKTKSVLTCSLGELLHSSSTSLPSLVWYRVADTPAYLSTSAAVSGELLAIGGCDENVHGVPFLHSIHAVHKYNRFKNSWELISSMPTANYCCLTTVLANSEVIMTLGGYSDLLSKPLDAVSLAMASLACII